MKKKSILLLAVVGLLSFTVSARPKQIAEDFDAMNMDNMGMFTEIAEETDDGIAVSFDDDIRVGDSGLAMRIDYDIDSVRSNFAGVWMRFATPMNVSKLKYLTFWVKGSAENGFTDTVKIDLKSSPEQCTGYYVDGISKDWKKVRISLKDFPAVHLKEVKEMAFVFDEIVSAKQGTIYIDNVVFE